MTVTGMRQRVRMAAVGAALVLAAPPVEASCALSDIVQDGSRMAALQPGLPHAHFVVNGARVTGCLDARAACRMRAHLKPGNTVLVGPKRGALVCAGFTSPDGVTTTGWLPSTALVTTPDAMPAPSDLAGHWVGPEQDVTIRSAPDGTLTVEGSATWGLGDARRREGGSVRTGALAATARSENGVLAFTVGTDGDTLPFSAGDPTDCRIRLRRRGPYVVVRDNGACGGVNVTFTGLYARKG